MKQPMILIIEDDMALRENTAELLELEGYEVCTAPNGRIGIEMVKKRRPHLIVCDIMMPEIDGYGVLEAVSKDPETRHIPFIFLSAKTEHKEIRKGMDQGADDYLTKPYEEQELFSAIESRLAKAKILSEQQVGLDVRRSQDSDIRDLNALKNLFDDEGTVRTFGSGELIYKEGEHSNMVYLVLKGIVKNFKLDESGKELITALCQPDEFLGMTSLEDHAPHQESAVAVEEVEVAGISKNELRAILEQNHLVSIALFNVLTDSITEIKGKLLQMAYSSVRKKTAQTILQFVRIMGRSTDKSIRISRNDLASVAGIATESLIRTLSEFKKKGFIEIEGRNIRVLQLEALEAME